MVIEWDSRSQRWYDSEWRSARAQDRNTKAEIMRTPEVWIGTDTKHQVSTSIEDLKTISKTLVHAGLK